MTFDMNRAWEESLRLLKANRELVLVLAGLFIFLPAFALGVFKPETITGPEITDTERMAEQLNAYFAANGVWLVLLQLVQMVGILAILALFAKRRPTVGQAIGLGTRELFPLILGQLFLAATLSVIGGLLFGVFAAFSQALAIVFLIFWVAFVVYLLARLVAFVPILVFDRRLNPFTAMVDSWRLTKGKGGRIALFFFLLFLAIIVVSLLVGGVIALIAALFGDGTVAVMVASGLTTLWSAAYTVLLVAVIAAIFRQLVATDAAGKAWTATPGDKA